MNYYLAFRGTPVSSNMNADQARRALGSSELLAIREDRNGRWRRPWRQRAMGATPADFNHTCDLPEDITVRTWYCDRCGKAWDRDHLQPSKYAWFRDPMNDARWRDQ